MNKVIEIIKENKFLIAALLIIIAVFTGIAIYKNHQNEEVEDGRNPDNENQITDTYEERTVKANEYSVMHVKKLDVIKEYFRDYIKTSVDNPEEAYELLADETKQKYTLEEYKKYLKKINTINTANSKIEEYRINYEHEKTGYEIIDSEKNKFIIMEYSIWDYKVILLDKVS